MSSAAILLGALRLTYRIFRGRTFSKPRASDLLLWRYAPVDLVKKVGILYINIDATSTLMQSCFNVVKAVGFRLIQQKAVYFFKIKLFCRKAFDPGLFRLKAVQGTYANRAGSAETPKTLRLIWVNTACLQDFLGKIQ